MRSAVIGDFHEPNGAIFGEFGKSFPRWVLLSAAIMTGEL